MSEYSVKNSKEFITEIRGYSIECDEELVSFDVTALYTSLPVDRTLKVVAVLLEDDDLPRVSSSLTTQQVVDLLELCLRSTFFSSKTSSSNLVLEWRWALRSLR